MHGAYIEVATKPLARDYDEGEEVVVVEKGKELRMRLIESALQGETKIKVIPHQNGQSTLTKENRR